VIKVFGIEPEVMATPDFFREYFKDFGVEKGRWIGIYPSDWRRTVRNLIRGLSPSVIGPVKKNEMRDKIDAPKYSDRFVVLTDAPWDVAKDWLENAEDRVFDKWLDAILSTSNPRGHTFVLVAGAFDPDSAPYQVEVSLREVRDVEKLFLHVMPFIRHAKTIDIVDQYFKCDAPNKDSYIRFIELVVQQMRKSGRWSHEITFHLRKSDYYDAAVQRRGYTDMLQPILSPGEKIRLKFWEEFGNLELIHDRHLITDLGLMDSTYGWGDDPRGQTTTDLSLKSRTIYVARHSCFCGNGATACGLRLSPDCVIEIDGA
jgi:hypothetical protein